MKKRAHIQVRAVSSREAFIKAARDQRCDAVIFKRPLSVKARLKEQFSPVIERAKNTNFYHPKAHIRIEDNGEAGFMLNSSYDLYGVSDELNLLARTYFEITDHRNLIGIVHPNFKAQPTNTDGTHAHHYPVLNVTWGAKGTFIGDKQVEEGDWLFIKPGTHHQSDDSQRITVTIYERDVFHPV